MPKALITGITGQDGSYLAELLLDKGYEVHGTVRHGTDPSKSRLQHLYRAPDIYGKGLFLHTADLTEPQTMRQALRKVAPEEVYHLASQSHVGLSYKDPEATCEVTGMSTLRLLEMLRTLEAPPRFFHASSSQIFGTPTDSPQDETTAVAPTTPYGCAKAFATQIVGVYRRSFGLFASNGILFNHESPRRGEDFVTRKICRAAAAIKLGRQKELILGDLTAQRDWGHARDYVLGMWLVLQHPAADDFVFATGELHSVQEAVEAAFLSLDLDWTKYVRSEDSLRRPSEPHRLVGNAAKAKRLLGWEPRVSFHELIAEMTQADLDALQGREAGGRPAGCPEK